MIKASIAQTHSPDLELYRSRPGNAIFADVATRSSVLTPYTNIDDLKTGSVLPVFMHSRAFAPPHKYALRDHLLFRWAQEKLILGPVRPDGYAIWLGEEDKGKVYGDMVAFEDDSTAAKWSSLASGLDPASGLLVLEAQKNTYQFLLECCKGMLSAEELGHCKLRMKGEMKENSFKLPSDIQMREVDTTFQPPSPSDRSLRWILNYIRDLRVHAEKHVDHLRIDPSYFAAKVRARHSGRKLSNKKKAGTRTLDSVSLQSAVKEVFSDGFRSYVIWLYLGEMVHLLIKATRANNEADVSWRVAQFRAWLHKVSDLFTNDLLSSSHDVRLPHTNPDSQNSRDVPIVEQDAHKFTWLLEMLSAQKSEQRVVDTLRIAKDLQRLLDENNMHKHVSDSFVTALDGVYSIHEFLDELSVTPEWCANQNADLDGYISKFEDFAADWLVFKAHLSIGVDLSQIAELCLPLEEKLTVPMMEGETEDSDEKCRAAERLLAKVMWPFRTFLSGITGSKFSSRNYIDFVSPIQYLWQSKPPDEESLSTEASTDNHESLLEQNVEQGTVGDIAGESEQSTDHQSNDNGSSTTEAPTITDQTQDAEPAVAETQTGLLQIRTRGRGIARYQDIAEAKVPVDKRAYLVFFKLFSRKGDHTGGTLYWEDFVYAMRHVGFSVDEGRDGSAWGFKRVHPVTGDSELVTQHRPHGAKFQRLVILSLAGRLRRRLGWSLSNFEERA